MFKGTFNIIGTKIEACDYNYVIEHIQKNISENKTLLITPLASHTLVFAKQNKNLTDVIDSFDMRLPDSQWIRYAIHFLYGVTLKERVYGPELMLRICRMATDKKYPVYFYGTTTNTLSLLISNLKDYYCGIRITGAAPSQFRELTDGEKKTLVEDIVKSQAKILFIGLGSPLQEESAVWLKKMVPKPIIIVTVGAAFDFIAKTKPQAPNWMGRMGLEWLFRLISEPQRLWRRYLVGGTLFLFYVLKQKISYSISVIK